MTLEQLKKITPKYAALWLPYLQQACAKYNINTPEQQLAFLAQVAHESGNLFYTEELASGKAYEGRKDLGNTVKGDGVKFKGRGLIQITGRNNYTAISKEFKIDCVKEPSLLGAKNVGVCNPTQLKFAALTAAYFWHINGLNTVASYINLAKDIDEGQNLIVFKQITKTINGGYNGLQDRIDKFKNLAEA